MVSNAFYLVSGQVWSAFDIGYNTYLKEWERNEGKEIRPKHPKKIKRRLLIAEGKRIAENHPRYLRLKYERSEFE